MFRRFDQSFSRQNWLNRNNYPNRAFGVGRGFNRSFGFGGRGFGGRGFGGRGFGGRRFGGGGFFGGFGNDCFFNGGSFRWGNFGRFGRFNRCRRFNNFFSFGLGLGFGRSWGCRRPLYNAAFYDPFFTLPFYSYGTSFGYLPVTTAYYDSSYPVYSAPGAPVNIDIDNYGYGSFSEYDVDDTNLSVVPPSTNPPQVTTSHRELAEAAFMRGEYDLARREAIQAMLVVGDDAELEMFYAFTHFATLDFVTASQALRRALGADPSMITQPLDIAAYYSNATDFENQFLRLERTIAANPYDPEFLFLAGYVQYAAGNADLAHEILKRAASRAPNDIQILSMRDAALRAANILAASQNDMDRPSASIQGTNSSTMYIGPNGQEFIPEVRPTYPVGNE